MKNSYMVASMKLLPVVALCFGLSAHAQEKMGGSSLLTVADKVQLASWLSEGPIALTKVYSKVQGDTSRNFHLAADGKGRTFSVMRASNELGQSWLVGGYNPQSWSTAERYNMTLESNQRTAFIFNLTDGSMHRQTPKTYALDTVGAYQTYNGAAFGPTFGLGYDLSVPENLTTGGHSSLYSYIDPVTGGFGESVLDGSLNNASNVTYGAIEVFTISLVPEPGAAGMMVAGLGLLSSVIFRNRKLPA
ncbi:hypothetical protein ACFDR9_001266 [Janthinobacterium sp. CG_23.3]|uniref:PEP_CTERM-anchored TLD domain-containing protein n=1 Tax=Janthinobacterium sp. CG_23.3 TaxID=3349634 RepID=UPI0038D4D0B9